MSDARRYVYLAFVKVGISERVVARGVFKDREAAAALAPLPGEEARNIVGVFEDVDMGMHVGFQVNS